MRFKKNEIRAIATLCLVAPLMGQAITSAAGEGRARTAESGGLRGPLVGYTIASGGGIAPIRGIPGAAVVPFDNLLQSNGRVVIAPGQRYAFFDVEGERRVGILEDGIVTETIPMPDEIGRARVVGVSPEGKCVVFQEKGTTRFIVAGGFPATPRIVDIDLSTGNPKQLIAVSDGCHLLVYLPETEQVSLYRERASGPGIVMNVRERPLGAFTPGRDDAVLLNGATGDFLRTIDGEAITIPAPELRDVGATTLLLADQGRTAIVTSPTNSFVFSTNLESGVTKRIETIAPPRSITTSRTPNVFIVTLDDAAPIWLLVQDRENSRVVPVPISPSEGGEQEETEVSTRNTGTSRSLREDKGKIQ